MTFSSLLSLIQQNQLPHAHTKYLPHLDGLRAIALLGVLLFHFRVPHFQGGYAGVDVFLSLSGFLITRNILHQLSENKFNLFTFYKRRFFRLYPASAVTVLFTLFLSFLSFPPGLFARVGNSALSALLFHANVFFNIQSGYFDSSSETKPFLHFWSLSLEEQYYFVWAPLLVLINRFTNRSIAIAGVLGTMLIGSFTFAVLLGPHHPAIVFFQLPSRIWQFAAGALTAVLTSKANPTIAGDDKSISYRLENSNGYVQVPQEPDKKIILSPDDTVLNIESEQNKTLKSQENDTNTELVKEEKPVDISEETNALPPSVNLGTSQSLLQSLKELLCLLAFVILLGSYVLLPPSAPMHLMLPTTISTCVIVALGDTIFARNVLTVPLLRAVGHLSYSAYLVHWPIFVFTLHLYYALGFGSPYPITMFAVTWGAAMILRRSIEDPVRRGERRKLFGLLTTSAFAFAIVVIVTNGLPVRVGNVNTVVSGVSQRGLFQSICLTYSKEDPRFSAVLPSAASKGKMCLLGDVNGNRSKYAFFGDSFTMHLSSALMDIGLRRAEWYMTSWTWGCRFVALELIEEQGKYCRERLKNQWDVFSNLPADSIVVIANRWEIGTTNRSRSSDIQILYDAITKAGHEMVLIGEAPGVDEEEIDKYYACADVAVLPLARLWAKLTRQKFTGGRNCFDSNKGLDPYPTRAESRNEDITMLPKLLPNMKYVDVISYLCYDDSEAKKEVLCRLPQGDPDVLFDNGYCRDGLHYSFNGSRYLSKFYEEQLFGAVNSIENITTRSIITDL